jgi:hypothetical protein
MFQKARSLSQEREQDFEDLLENQKDNFELDAGLFELRRKYIEMKKERQKCQKDADLLENKLKLLGNEELKVLKKEQKDKKTQDELDKIRTEILLERESVYMMKIDKEKEILVKKSQIHNMREHIRSALSSWRVNLAEKNKSELQKFKILKLENEQIIELNKKESIKKNRESCEQIKIQKLNSSEKKKREEVIF